MRQTYQNAMKFRKEKLRDTSDGRAPQVLMEGFAIRGTDGVWQWAHAEIDGDTVLVSHPAIPNPAAVRYDWGCTVFGNLTNSSALPAAPFTTETPAEK